VVVARPADVEVSDRGGLRGALWRGGSIELVVENGFDGAVGPGADLDGPFGGGFDARRAKSADEPNNAETGAITLLGMGPSLQDLLAERRRRRADPAGVVSDALDGPAGVAPVAGGHVPTAAPANPRKTPGGIIPLIIQKASSRARVTRMRARVPARISSPAADPMFYYGSMANPFEIRSLTARNRAYIEEQRIRNVAGAFARLRRALNNTARPAWGQSTPDRLAYLQAKFDRRVSDPGSRMAAATLIEEWRQHSKTGLPNFDPDRPVSQYTDGELMAALSERQYGQCTAKADRPPPPPKPARMPRKPSNSRTSKEPPVLPQGANELPAGTKGARVYRAACASCSSALSLATRTRFLAPLSDP
jgi:hypothetical protein